MIPIKEFMSHPDEWHAFVIGCAEAFYPRRPRYYIALDDKNPIKGEYWYYVFGHIVGVLIWIGVVMACAGLLLPLI